MSVLKKVKSGRLRSKNKDVDQILGFLAWFTGIVVSIAVGFGLVNGTLILPSWLGGTTKAGYIITLLSGWVIILTTLVGVILAIFRRK